MALDACIAITPGFEGSSKKAGHLKGSSIVHAVVHSVETPVDLAHGSVTHRRQHSLLTVEMVLDPSVYQIYQAVIDKDKDGSKKLAVALAFYRPNQDNVGLWGAGETAPYFTIELADAFIASVEFIMGDVRASGAEAGAAAGGRGEYLRVKIAYRQITWTFKNGNKTSIDAWDK